MYCLRAVSTLIAVLMTACVAKSDSAPAREPIFLTAQSTLSFDRDNDGEVHANYAIRFRTPQNKTLCVRNGFLPESDDFDPTLIKFLGPKGLVRSTDPTTDPNFSPRRGPPRISKIAMRFLVFRRDAIVDLGVRIGKVDYVFSEPGRYTAEFVIPVYDCAKLAEISDYDDRAPGWYLGNLVTSTSGVLN